MIGLFSMTYLGPISWYAKLLSCERVVLEEHESWQKQSYRSRCYIDSPNGTLMLNIPVRRIGSEKTSDSILISYYENWSSQHWKAILTAYHSSPFFEILGPELEAHFQRPIEKLIDWNKQLLELMLNWLQIIVPIEVSKVWEANPMDKEDYREIFHPKRPIIKHFDPYFQIFGSKFGFRPNLSIIDLLFNEGAVAYDYLKQL